MCIMMKTRILVDGDTLITEENFVFSVFGYQHPKERVFSFLKYIPFELKSYFPLRFLKRSWRMGNVELARPEKLYTAQNFQKLLETFQNRFPQYVYFCPFRKKTVVNTPLKFIKRFYKPRECIQRLPKRKRKDRLQKLALELTTLLSTESGIPFEDFGIHGSIALSMHTEQSDIDLVVYGSRNFRVLGKVVDRLVDEGTLSYIFANRLDKVRKYRGRYKRKVFMYNAVRKMEEISCKYGDHKYSPVKSVTFYCEVADDKEAMFRPAIYQITNYQQVDTTSKLAKDEIPEKVVSMIGCYRNVARLGERVRVSGTLERVENVETDETYHQVVVGTGTREGEYIWPS